MSPFRILVFLLCCSSWPLLAEDIEAVTEHFPPFQQYDKKGELNGISVEIVEALARELKQNIPITVYPWARAFDIALKKENVLIFTISKTPERRDRFHWVYSFDIDNAAYFWVLAERSDLHDIDWNKASSLTAVSPRSDTYNETLLREGFSPDDNLFLTNDFSQSINMLLSQHADFLFAGNVSMLSQLQAIGMSPSLFKKVPSIETKPAKLSFALSKSTPLEQVEKYRLAFKKLEREGYIARFLFKYLSSTD